MTEITRQQTNMHKYYMQQVIFHRGVMTWSYFIGGGWGWVGAGCINVYRITSKWRPDILNEIEYLVFHNYNVFFFVEILIPLEFTLNTVKMDNGENMENARYVMNDDNAGFINQKKNRNTSTKTEYDLKLMTNYFASIYT